jgi:hypothetical protein
MNNNLLYALPIGQLEFYVFVGCGARGVLKLPIVWKLATFELAINGFLEALDEILNEEDL